MVSAVDKAKRALVALIRSLATRYQCRVDITREACWYILNFSRPGTLVEYWLLCIFSHPPLLFSLFALCPKGGWSNSRITVPKDRAENTAPLYRLHSTKKIIIQMIIIIYFRNSVAPAPPQNPSGIFWARPESVRRDVRRDNKNPVVTPYNIICFERGN